MQVGREIDIHSRQQHPHIVQLFAAFEDLSSINLVQEFASRGNLMKLLSAAGGVLPEDFVAFKVAMPVLAALSHLHFQVNPTLCRSRNHQCSLQFRQ